MKSEGDIKADVPEVQRLQEEVERLNKIVRVLMDRSERMTSKAESEYGLFQRRLVLGEFVRQRTEELHEALSQNETITRRLRVSESRFRAVAEQSLVGIAVVESSGFLYLNAQFAEIFGYTQSELTALRLMSTVSDESIQGFTDHLHMCQTGQTREDLLAYGGRRKDGSIVDLELSASRMTAGDDGEAMILVVRDVTARKQAERSVQILNERLAELAVRDPLTGLYNRRFMEASLEREFIAAARNSSALSVVICDIDHFKAVNDTFGHQAGDEVLQAFGALLRQHCRKSDIACRYGGEEFLLVFPGMAVGLATDWAERVREAAEKAQLEAGTEAPRITASFGVASFPAHAQTWQEVIGAADDALYSAKAGGRNQVRRAPFLVAVSEDSSQRSRAFKSRPRGADQAVNDTRM